MAAAPVKTVPVEEEDEFEEFAEEVPAPLPPRVLVRRSEALR